MMCPISLKPKAIHLRSTTPIAILTASKATTQQSWADFTVADEGASQIYGQAERSPSRFACTRANNTMQGCIINVVERAKRYASQLWTAHMLRGLHIVSCIGAESSRKSHRSTGGVAARTKRNYVKDVRPGIAAREIDLMESSTNSQLSRLPALKSSRLER